VVGNLNEVKPNESVVKCSWVKFSEGLSNRVSNIIRRYEFSCLYGFFIYHILSYFFGYILYHFSTTLTEGFPCFFLSCKANARV
jgi:hypothetical protein